MLTARIQRIFLISGIISLAIAYAGLWLRFINDPVERTGSDFMGFYSVGKVAQSEGPAYVYEPSLQQKVQQDVVGFELAPGQVLINQHLPFLIPILQALVTPRYVESFYRWNVLMMVIYTAGVLLLSRILQQRRFDRTSVLLVALGGLLFYPLYFSLWNGQDTAICFLGLSIWAFGLLSGKEMTAGFGLGLVTVRPQIALAIAIPMFFRYKKVFWGFVISSGGLALLSMWVIGVEGTRSFLNVIWISAEGQWYGLNEASMFNLVGLLLRAGIPGLTTDVIHAIGWTLYGLAIVGSSLLTRKYDVRDGLLGPIITTAVFLSPHLHYHDLTLLLIPLYELIWMSSPQENHKRILITTLPVIISFLLLIGNVSSFLEYAFAYILMGMLIYLPFEKSANWTFRAQHQS